MTTKNWSLTGRKPTACQRDWHIWHQTDPTSHSPARSAAAQLGKQHVLTSKCLEHIGRYLLHTPRAVSELPLQNKESIVTIDGLFRCRRSCLPETETLDFWRMLARRSTHLGNIRNKWMCPNLLYNHAPPSASMCKHKVHFPTAPLQCRVQKRMVEQNC